MAKEASFFLPIVKVDKTPDGFRMVTGKVSTERIDLDGQIADYQWAKKEAQSWFEIANVREMHQRSAVGKGLDLQLDDTNKTVTLTAKIVDPVAITKLDEGVYTGYSFGAKSVPGNPIKVVKDAQAPNGRIVGGKWIEITIADRPANPDSVLGIAKMAGGALEVDQVLGEFNEAELSKLAEPVESPANTDAEKAAAVAVPQPEATVTKQLTGEEAIHNDALNSARVALRTLIQQEVAEAEPGQTYQIQVLVDALTSLDCFESSEFFEAEYASYGKMATELAAITDKDTRRGLYKSVSEALKKAAGAYTAAKEVELQKRAAVTEVKPDGTVTVWPDAEPKLAPPAAQAATAATTEPATPAADKTVDADTTKFLTAESIKAVLPDQLKAMLPELLKEHSEVLKEALADAFAKKELEKTVETLGKRAQPGGPVMNADAAGLRTIEKSHPVNAVVDPGDVPLDALQEMAKYAELSKVDDIPTAHSARRMLTKLQNQYGLVPA